MLYGQGFGMGISQGVEKKNKNQLYRKDVLLQSRPQEPWGILQWPEFTWYHLALGVAWVEQPIANGIRRPHWKKDRGSISLYAFYGGLAKKVRRQASVI